MSGSLATLASDCISELLQYLNGDDFIALMKAGNRLLRHKLLQKCSSLHFQATAFTLFPFEALRLQNLRSLAVHGIKEAPTYLDFRHGGELALSVGHKTLKTLDLRFANAPAFLLRSQNRSIPRLTVLDRFPMLTTLHMSNIKSAGMLHSLFDELPQTLRTLSFGNALDKEVSTTNYPSLSLNSIANLPRHLTSLTLQHFMLIEGTDSELVFSSSLFPPNLQHLELSWLDNATILDYFPSELQTLRFIAAWNTPGFIWRASRIPPKLFELVIGVQDWILELDAHLPFNLEIFDTHRCFGKRNKLTFEDLPIGLKYFDRILLRNSINRMSNFDALFQASVFNRFHNIENATIYFESDVAHIPRRPKSLEFAIPLHLASPLPNSLTKLTIQFPLHSNSIKCLPETLRILVVQAIGPSRNGENLTSQFPPWNADNFAQLVSQVRLEEFNTVQTSFESTRSLAPLSGMKSLKKFKLLEIGPEDMLESPNWLPQCLPRDLSILHLQYTKPTYGLAAIAQSRIKTSDDFLRLCNLCEVTPHLKSLTVRSSHPFSVEFERSFGTLPQELLKFKIDFLFGNLAPYAVSLLPRALKSLNLFMCPEREDTVSNEYFEALPESLQAFFFRFPFGVYRSLSENNTLNEELFEMLPRTICSVKVYSSPELTMAAEKFIRSNPLLEDTQSDYEEDK